MSHNSEDIKQKRFRRLRKWLKIITVSAWIFICVAVALLTFISGEGGAFNPAVSTLPAMLAMTFPAWLVANILIIIINFFVYRRLIWINFIALLLTFDAVMAFSPVNIKSGTLTPEEERRSFKLMTYNTFGFHDDEGIYPNGTNRTATQLIQSDADIICLQEVGYINDMIDRRFYSLQVDSINDIYPFYAFDEERMVAILSKYPLKEIKIPKPGKGYSGFKAAEVDIKGNKVLIVSVHLESIGLNEEDKIVYHSMTDGSNSSAWLTGGKIIYHKLSEAYKKRALEAKLLRHSLDSLGYENVIVAGDFNDIEGCYAMRVIEGNEMHSVFSECGMGPRITYHNNRFLFNIDHILYKGDMKAVETHRGEIKSSDHYPVYCTFVLDRAEPSADSGAVRP